ncbi:MAG TPA: hypothetical protein VMA36_12275 [Candidatus Limnocylindria bacterium]|jgi:hypothetical protein|nr:hypothetical protein [Candidatus Limnocylindria bacterium]
MTPGLATLIDQVGPAAIRGHEDALWRLIYTRGYVDVDAARPTLDRVHSGMLVYAAPLHDGRTLLVVDTAQRLIGAAGRFAAVPPVGSAVRLTGFFDGQASWKLLIDETLRFDGTVDFAPAAGVSDQGWIATLRTGLDEITAHEARRREAIAERRRAIPALGDAEPAAHPAIYTALERLESAHAESRARSAAAFSALAALETLAGAPFRIDGVRAPLAGLEDPRRAHDVLRAIALLQRALPRGRERVAV